MTARARDDSAVGMRSFAAISAVVLAAACGGAPAQREPAHRWAVDAPWIEPAPAGASARPADEVPARRRDARASSIVELADGARLQTIVAVTWFDTSLEVASSRPAGADGSFSRCAVYALRVTARGLEEGTRSLPCPEGGVNGVSLESIPFRAVESDRARELARVLPGADARPATAAAAAPAQPGRADRIQVRVTTDRGTIDGSVGPVRWPSPASDEPERPLGRKPQNLGELWEAVLYPTRYVARDA